MAIKLGVAGPITVYLRLLTLYRLAEIIGAMTVPFNRPWFYTLHRWSAGYQADIGYRILDLKLCNHGL